MRTETITPLDPTFTNYAFISYSHKSKNDVRWAKWLQSRLETYRLPTALRKTHPHIPARIHPIFRDATDLSGSDLTASLQEELRASQYLIVICSPNAAASKWVQWEIEYFLSLGRADNIIPFVIDGTPNAPDPTMEAFPEPLRRMERERLGISVATQGRRGSFLQVISTLLNLRYDQVVMRDRRRRRRNGLLLGSGALAALLFAFSLLWYNLPHQKYYRGYVLRWEIPEGIYEVDAQARASMSSNYRITTQRGKVIRMERVNPEGYPMGRLVKFLQVEYPIYEYEYGENGKLSVILEKDATGALSARKLLTYNEATRQIAIDYRLPNNNIQASALQGDTTSVSLAPEDDNKSEITRLLNTYDENGLLQRSLFQKDNLGNPARDSNGVYGKRYTYNSLGQVASVGNLNEAGDLHNCKYGWATEEYTYQNAYLIETWTFDAAHHPAQDKYGLYGTRAAYDKDGNFISWEGLNFDGSLRCDKNGIARQLITYDSHGHPISTAVYDENGLPCYSRDEDFHECRFEYDKNGRIIGMAYYDTSGNPMVSKIAKTSKASYQLDEVGRTIELRFYDEKGDPTPDSDSGVPVIRAAYDRNGNHTDAYYLDQKDQPMLSKWGYASVHLSYDDLDRCVRVAYWDEAGNLTRSTENFAVMEKEYDNLGNLSAVSFLDETGERLCYCDEGYAKAVRAYDSGNLISIKYFGPEGKPVFSKEGYHEVRYDYDEKGNRIRLSYYDFNGRLVQLHDGYAVVELDYDEYGNCIEKRWLDTNHQISSQHEIGRKVYLYDQRGNMIHSACYPLNPFSEAVRIIDREYDDHDQLIREIRYDQNGDRIKNDYAEILRCHDSRGNIIREEILDAQGLPYQHDTAERNVLTYEYDEFGNCLSDFEYHKNADGTEIFLAHTLSSYDPYGYETRREWLDRDGNPTASPYGYTAWEKEYDINGNTLSLTYYDSNGSLFPYERGIAHREYTYNAMGKITELRSYGADGKPLTKNSSFPAIIRSEYDRCGNHIKYSYFDDHGDPFDENGEAPAMVEYDYDMFGYQTEIRYYDRSQNLVMRTETLSVIQEVYPGTDAEAAGIIPGSFVLRHGDWNYYTADPDTRLHDLQVAITLGYSSEKTMHFYLPDENDQPQFTSVTLPAGISGVLIVSNQFDAGLLDRVRPQYEAWLSQNP